MTADDLATAVTTAAARELDNALDRIHHCLRQLTDQQVWLRARPDSNSIGNLILHLSGNVRQWLVAGLSGTADTRDRPAEFAARDSVPKQELLQQLDAVLLQAKQVLAPLTAQQLVQGRRIQGFDVSGLDAIFSSVPHFRGHTQEIIHMTRAQLGDAYQFAWTPTTIESGAPRA